MGRQRPTRKCVQKRQVSSQGQTKKPSASSQGQTKKPSASSQGQTKKPSASSEGQTNEQSDSRDKGVNCKKSVKQNNVQKKSGAEEHSPCRNTKNKQSKKNGGTAHPPTKRKKKSPATSSKKNKQPWELTTKERYNSLIRGEHCQISSEFGISTKLLYGISWQGLEESCFDQSIDVDFGILLKKDSKKKKAQKKAKGAKTEELSFDIPELKLKKYVQKMMEDHPGIEDSTFHKVGEIIQKCLKDTMKGGCLNQRAEGFLESLLVVCSRTQRKQLIERQVDKHSLLSIVCDIGNVDALQFFLRCSDVDVNAKSNECILMTAIMKGHLDIVKLLIKHGKKVTCYTDVVACPLVVACGGYPIDFEERNISQRTYDFPFVKKEEKVYDHSHYLETKKRFPEHHCRIDMVKILINSGALEHIIDLSLFKCFKLAIDEKNWDVVQLLCENVKTVDVRDNMGCSVLGYAVKMLNLTTIRFLIKHGADINDTRMIINEKLSKQKDDSDCMSVSDTTENSLMSWGHDIDRLPNGEDNSENTTGDNGKETLVASHVTNSKNNKSDGSSPPKKRRVLTGQLHESNKPKPTIITRSEISRSRAYKAPTSSRRKVTSKSGKSGTVETYDDVDNVSDPPQPITRHTEKRRGKGDVEDSSTHDINHNISRFSDDKVYDYVHPIVYVAAKQELTILYYFLNSEVIPFNDKMNAIEMMGALRAMSMNSNSAFGIWDTALLYRKHHPVKEGEISEKQNVAEPQDCFCGLQEPKTIEELDSLCPNSTRNALLIAMSVYERTVGYHIDFIMEPVKKLRKFLFQNKEYTMYVEFCTEFLPVIFTYADDYSSEFDEGLRMLRHMGLFVARAVMLEGWKPPFELLFKVGLCFFTAGKSKGFAENTKGYNFHDLELYLTILHILLDCDKTDEEVNQFEQFMYDVISSNARNMESETLLHMAVKANAVFEDFLSRLNLSTVDWDFVFDIEDSGSADMTYTLLHLGMDINVRDCHGNTPYHTFFYHSMRLCQESWDLMVDIHNVLDLFDAHPDTVNDRGETPISMAKTAGITLDLSWIPLKCLAANVIVKSNLPYKTYLPRSLQKYVDLHLKP